MPTYEVASVWRPCSSAGFGLTAFDMVTTGLIDSVPLQAQDYFVGTHDHRVELAGDQFPLAEVTGAPAGANDPPLPAVWPYATGSLYGKEMYMRNLTMYRGNRLTFRFTVITTDPDTNTTAPLALSDQSFKFTAKWDKANPDANAAIALTSAPGGGITILDPPNGRIQVSIPPSATSGLAASSTKRRLYYDLQMTDGTDPYTLLEGDLYILPSVTLLP